MDSLIPAVFCLSLEPIVLCMGSASGAAGAGLRGSPGSRRTGRVKAVCDPCGQSSSRHQRDSSPGLGEDELGTGGGCEPRLSVIGFSQ